MKATYLRSHRSGKGNIVFTYSVNGTAEELENFKASQGIHYREDDKTGTPLWFTVKYAGNKTDLIITSNNKVIADMSKFEQAASLSQQFGGPLGQEIARQMASDLLGLNNNVPAPQAAPAPQAVPEASSDDLGGL